MSLFLFFIKLTNNQDEKHFKVNKILGKNENNLILSLSKKKYTQISPGPQKFIQPRRHKRFDGVIVSIYC